MGSRKNMNALALAAATVLLAGAALPVIIGDNPAPTVTSKSGLPAPGEAPRALKLRSMPPVQGNPSPSPVPAPAEATPVILAPGQADAVPAVAGNSGNTIGDALIEARIKNELFARTGKSSYPIEVESANGVVNLSGLSPDRAHRDRAMRIARQVAGVREVHDRMEIKPVAVAE